MADAQSPAQTKTDTVAPGLELPLPEVPATLTAPKERAEYIILHFWDAMDFGDTLRCRNRSFMEQNLVNFLSLFPHADESSLPRGIGRLLGRAAADSAALGITLDIAGQYLYSPGSPMRSESQYILFLEEYLRLPGLPQHTRVRPALQLETARKNRPGTFAADFTYTDRGGSRRTLRDTPGREWLLLMFYDPECPSCAEVAEATRESPSISKLIGEGRLAVLAIYTEGDRKVWSNTKASMPREWTVGIDNSRIAERGLYNLASMPALYLLKGGDKTVVLKEASLPEIEKAVSGD